MHSLTRHFGNSTRLVQRKQFLQNKFQITIEELEDNEAPRRCYLVGFLFHSCKCTQTPKLTRGYSKKVASKKLSSELLAALGFFLFGIPESQFCVCISSSQLKMMKCSNSSRLRKTFLLCQNGKKCFLDGYRHSSYLEQNNGVYLMVD